MDYQKIVLQGYYDENNHEQPEKYFIREFRKAEDEFFEAEDFFNGCLNAVKTLEKHIEHLCNDQRNFLESLLNQAIKQNKQETIEEYKQKLASLSEDDFPIPLRQLTNNRIGGNIYKEDLLQIKLAINKVYSEKAQTPPLKNKIDDFNKSGTHLSVSDRAIIFYYLDEAGEKKGAKTKRFENFIKDNGISTTWGNFKKEYYEIENRINRKNDKKPLPPERIEKILPYIEKSKKATERAKSDMHYLTNEVSKSKEKDY